MNPRTYADSAPLHAATAIGSTWTAGYDAAGNMTCRAPSTGSTCAGNTPTGAQLTYDADGSLSGWQPAPAAVQLVPCLFSTTTRATGWSSR